LSYLFEGVVFIHRETPTSEDKSTDVHPSNEFNEEKENAADVAEEKQEDAEVGGVKKEKEQKRIFVKQSCAIIPQTQQH
jgi:hypothetical protein